MICGMVPGKRSSLSREAERTLLCLAGTLLSCPVNRREGQTGLMMHSVRHLKLALAVRCDDIRLLRLD